MKVPLEQFVRLLSVSGLLTPRDAAMSCAACAAAGLQSADDVATRLVEQGKLTPYQAKRLLEGKEKGLVLGDYVVLEELGAGGMGHVYKAHHRRMDREVALKVLAPRALASPAALERFHREVRAAARLIHPHIVTAFDAGEQDGIQYLVMEYVEGQDLGTVVNENGELPVEEAVNCILQAARGLDYAHSRGIVHRDIKPGNLLLDWAGNVRILDMGLAQIDADLARIEAPSRRHRQRDSQAGEILGTLDYMAPEQAMPGQGVDARADIYSLGCTLFRLVTGRAPYGGASAAEKIRNHREGTIPSLQSPRIEVPPALDSLFRRMIAKRPDDRPRSMGEVIGALESCLLAPRTIVASAVSGETGSTYNSASDIAIPPAPGESHDFAYSRPLDHSHESTVVEVETLAHVATEFVREGDFPAEPQGEPFSAALVEPHLDVMAPPSEMELAPPETTALTPSWPESAREEPVAAKGAEVISELDAARVATETQIAAHFTAEREAAIGSPIVAPTTAPTALPPTEPAARMEPAAREEPVAPADILVENGTMPVESAPASDAFAPATEMPRAAAIEPEQAVPLEAALAVPPATTACLRPTQPEPEESAPRASDARPWSMSIMLLAIVLAGILATLVGAFLVWYWTQGNSAAGPR